MPRLIITTPKSTTEFTLDRDTYTIGRSATNDIVIDDMVVSRQHARLERTPEGYKITDLGSLNGLLYGPEAITERILNDGDVLNIGDSVSLTYIAPVKEPVKELEPVPAGPPAQVKDPEQVLEIPPSPVKAPEPVPITPPTPPARAKTAAIKPSPTMWSKLGISWRLVALLICLFIIGLAAGYLYSHYVLSP